MNKMILLHFILISFLPFLSAQNDTSVTSAETLISKHVRSGDLPEDYHMATVSSEMVDKAEEAEQVSSPMASVNSTSLETSTVHLPTSASTEHHSSSTSEELHSASTSLPQSTLAVDINQIFSSTPSIISNTNQKNTDNVNSTKLTVMAEARSFTMEENTEEMEAEKLTTLRPITNKPHKIKKKILISRPKILTEKLGLDKVDADKTDLIDENSTETSTIRRNDIPATSFYSFSSSTTEIADFKHSTNSLIVPVIEKLVNNNLLNVIDTSLRPTEEETTVSSSNRVPVRNRLESNEYSPTGQTDWVPLVSDQPSGSDWSPFVPAVVTTERNTSAKKNRIRFPVEISTTEKQNDTSSESNMDVTSWTLTSSKFTRKPLNLTEDLSQVSLFNTTNALHKKLKENIQSVFSRATERYKSENATKEHNQVLKNTIADSVIAQTTPSSKWRPVITIPPPTMTTMKKIDQTSILDFTTVRSNDETAPTDNIDVDRTIAYEIMKIPTVAPQLEKSDNETNSILSTEAPVKVGSSNTETLKNEVVVPITFKIDESTEMPKIENVTTETPKIENTTSVTPQIENDTTENIKINNSMTEIVAPKQLKVKNSTESKKNENFTTPKIEVVTSANIKNEQATEVSFDSTTDMVFNTIAPAFEVVSSTKNLTSSPGVEITTEVELEEATIYATARPTNDVKNETNSDDNRTTSTETSILDRPVNGEITEENVPAYLRLTVETSEIELCHRLPELRQAILKILSDGTNSTVSSDCLVLLNLNPTICQPVRNEERAEDAIVRHRPVNMFLMDENGDFNKNLSETFLRLWGEAGLDFLLPILKVDFVTPIPEGTMEPGMSSGVVAAIVISCVAGLCLILLGVLFVIMKRRQKKFNYGQRCTPVSLDAYSLDSVSIRNSSRRKGMRASKRSYGNAAFDDPEVPSHPVNFAGLANFSMEKGHVHEEFSIIPQVAPRPDELPPGVEARNRYANVIPLPETRVVLSATNGEPNSDYINANFVKGLNSNDNLYIAAQAPMDTTLADWWRMIWEQQVKVVLMLTALQENGVEKCSDYLPPNEVTDNIRLFGDFQITLKKRDVKDKYIVSTLQLKNMENSLWREVTHLWYVGWPDSGVPTEPNSLIAFLIEARSQIKTSSGAPAPSLVHCSPGTGRTGTIIACDMLIREFEQKRLVDIPRCVYHLRRCRAGAVQTRDQYAFIYQVLNTYATKLTGGALETI